jgi:hypothetical protein
LLQEKTLKYWGATLHPIANSRSGEALFSAPSALLNSFMLHDRMKHQEQVRLNRRIYGKQPMHEAKTRAADLI